MSQPSVVKQLRPDPNKIIEMLEEVLCRAKAGEFDSVVVVMSRPDHTWDSVESGVNSMFKLSGMIGQAWWSVNERLRNG